MGIFVVFMKKYTYEKRNHFVLAQDLAPLQNGVAWKTWDRTFDPRCITEGVIFTWFGNYENYFICITFGLQTLPTFCTLFLPDWRHNLHQYERLERIVLTKIS
jgi:hypothetical protein